MKQIIMIFIGGYLPGEKYGGPVTSIENFANQMCDIYEIRIVCNDHDFKETERYSNINEGWNTVGNADVYYTNERDYSTANFERIIKPYTDRIAMFYLSGTFYVKMNYAAIRLAKKYHIPVLLAPRGDILENAMHTDKKKLLKKVVFLYCTRMFGVFKRVYFQTTSREETEAVKKWLKTPDKRIFELENLPMKADSNSAEKIKEKDKLKVLFISRIQAKKNLLCALNAMQLVSDQYEVEFDIYGPEESEEYWQQCSTVMEQINKKKSNIRVTYKGNLKPADAKKVYSKYHCFIFPTRSENYGHVIVESMFSNCPVILSKGTTPWDDYHENGGYIAELDNAEEFASYIEKIAAMDELEYKDLIEKNKRYVHEKFGVEELKVSYREIINEMNLQNRGRLI